MNGTPSANGSEASGLYGDLSSYATLIPALVAAFTPPASSNLNQDQSPANDDAPSFTYAPARRKPIRDYAGLAHVRVGHGIQSGGVDGYDLSNSEYFLAGGRG